MIPPATNASTCRLHVMRLLLLALTALLWRPTQGKGFGGIPGDYCKVRSPVQCCTSRDDDCTMPILGNHLCYCDMFCRRPHADDGDCCPDFKYVCENQSPQENVTRGECKYDGVLYRQGDRLKQNCNDCTCADAGGGSFTWRCDSNVCLIQDDLLKQVQNGNHPWRGSNHSEFWGQTLSDGVKYRLGTLKPGDSVQNMNEILIEVERNIPSVFDARDKWPNYIHPIRNQENCGSSWTFSTTSTSADRLAIMSQGKLNAELSPQHLLSCNQAGQRGCDGGFIDRAWWYIRKFGVVSENCYPYNSGRTNDIGRCQINRAQFARTEGVTCPSGDTNNKVYQMTPPYRVSSKVQEIQTEILHNGPVQATFKVHEDFYMYSSGVYKYLDLSRNKPQNYKLDGYHSVRILGWGTDNGTPYWLCANSWGERWGDSGLFKILRGQNHCEIESFVVGVWGKGQKKRKRKFKVRKVKRKRLRKLRI